MRTRPALAAVLLALVATTTACVGMPDAGPVVDADNSVLDPPEAGVERRAQPPQEDDSPQNIVNGFLQAMTAYPVDLQVARQFLTTDEQDGWDPTRRTITYTGTYSATGTGSAITVRLDGAQWVDARGSWRGDRGNGAPDLGFTLTRENKEWRIASAPDAFVIPADWFQDHYVQRSVYYFDPTASILVPEPVFVQADQLTAALVRALLDGPGPRLAEVVRTFVPPGLTPGLSVPVDENGVATISLQGEDTRITPETAKLLVYQFAWTLKQVEGLTAFRITLGDEPVTMSGGSSNQFSVDLGSEYDPADVQASNQLFAVDNGSLETGDATGTQAVTGPLGSYGQIDSVGVELDATRAAAVTGGGTTLVLATVAADDDGLPITQVMSQATRLLPPAWDFRRLWIVDATADGARVSVLDPDQGLVPAPVTIDGISGHRVRDFIVSRDGTRFVAVVQGKDGDQLRISRIRQAFGRVVGTTPSQTVAWSSGDTQRIRDIGWRSPSTVGVLHLLTPQFTQLATVSVAGAAGPLQRLVLQDVATSLVSSPAENEPWYAVAGNQLLDPNSEAVTLPLGISSIQYVG